MNGKDKRRAASALFLLALLALLQLALTQGTAKPSAPRPEPPRNESLDNLWNENVGTFNDVTEALANKTVENSEKVRVQIHNVEKQVQSVARGVKDILPGLHGYLMKALALINENMEEAAVGLGGLMTAFQMIFGGGVSYLTSKMKNLSEHKIKIERGFDLQFRIFQKQELGSSKDLQVSPLFKELFQFLDYKDSKEVKLVLGTSGMGFSSNIKEWLRRLKKENSSTRYIYYDMSEPAIRTNSALENTHMACISDIIYSLLHHEDRNFVLRIFKRTIETVFGFFLLLWRTSQNNLLLCLLFLSTWWYFPQIFYLVTFFFLTKWLIIPVLILVASAVYRMGQVVIVILLKKERKKEQEASRPKLKIVIDNFQVLRAEFEDYFKVMKLKTVKDAIRTSDTPISPSSSPDTSTLQEHEELFLQNLTSLFNDVTSLQDNKTDVNETEIIIIVRNSEFYRDYLEKLRLNSPNPFKIMKFSQLPAEDSEFIIRQRTFENISIHPKNPQPAGGNAQDVNNYIAGIEVTRYLRIFHNNSKEIMKILRQLKLDFKYNKDDQSPYTIDKDSKQKRLKTKEEYITEMMRRSMHNILVHAQHLDELSSFQAKQSKEARSESSSSKKEDRAEGEQEEYRRYVGLFLGCLHKKLIFFANRKEGAYSRLQADYNELMEMINSEEGKAVDMVSTISPAHRHYLFDKCKGRFQLKTDARLLMLKWDHLIDYIRGDNNWADSLEKDFLYYYTENLRAKLKVKNLKHSDYHENYLGNADANYFAGEEINIDVEEASASGRKVFAEIVDFLTEQEVISEHIFFSRSIALANFYLQEKTKEKVLIQRFEMKKCKLANTIEKMENCYNVVKEEKMAKIRQFAEGIRQQFQSFIDHEACSYEEGMDWLAYYIPKGCSCSLADAVMERANKYLLARTNNSYVLRPFINNVMLYWDSFQKTRLNRQKLNAFVDQLSDNNPAERNVALIDYQWLLKSKTTICAYWYDQRLSEERALSKHLLGGSCGEFAAAVEKLQILEEDTARQQRILNPNNTINFKITVQANFWCLLAAFNLEERPMSKTMKKIEEMKDSMKNVRFQEIRRILFEYEQLLKKYHPDGLFKEVNVKYRKFFYQFVHGRRYELSPVFCQLVLAYHSIKQISQLPNEGLPTVAEVEKRLFNDPCSQFFQNLKQNDWIVLFKLGEKMRINLLRQYLIRDNELKKIEEERQKINERELTQDFKELQISQRQKEELIEKIKLEKRIKRHYQTEINRKKREELKRDFEQKEALLLTDIKSLLAALCFIS